MNAMPPGRGRRTTSRPSPRRALSPAYNYKRTAHAKRAGAAGLGFAPGVSPLTIPELEIGLRMLGRTNIDQTAFWDRHIARFRDTVLLAIRDTSEALLSPSMSAHLRLELQAQLEGLVGYIEVADRYVAERTRSSSAALS